MGHKDREITDFHKHKYKKYCYLGVSLIKKLQEAFRQFLFLPKKYKQTASTYIACLGFRLTKWVNYFRVIFDHF